MAELIPNLSQPAGWLPLAFMVIMGLSILAYVILDGFDLGVGILLSIADESDKDQMIASIGPFWDANETWLVLGIGILLVAFPAAHGIILGELYLAVALMLLGITLRGASFDFRVKAHANHKSAWDHAFFFGSLLTAIAQGYMLGRFVTGFAAGIYTHLFALFIGIALASGYTLLGAGWLVIKTSGELQLNAIAWGRRALLLLALGIAAVSVTTPLLNEGVYEKWFSLQNLLLLSPIPAMTAVLFFVVYRSLRRLPVRLSQDNHYGDWVPFAGTVGIFLLAFHGLAYSLFPYVVLDRLTIWQAASAPESLMFMFVGIAIVLPVIVAYSLFSYRVFSGKSTALDYQ